MSEYSSIALHTAPSTVIRHDLPPTPEPFRQIVGMELDGTSLWLPDTALPGDVPIAQRTYEVPWYFASRLKRYFQQQYINEVLDTDPDTLRNCLHFGIWMTRGISFPTRQHASAVVFNDARYTPALEHDTVGELSVIRSLRDLPAKPILHGLVKLADTGDYIQVMTRGGSLAITTAAEALAYHKTEEYLTLIVKGSFKVDPATWAVGHFSVSSALQPDYFKHLPQHSV